MDVATSSSGEAVSSKKPSQAVVERVADLEGVSPTELTPPLYSAIDPEALDSLFSLSTNDTPQAINCICFSYNGYNVQIQNDGNISISEV